MNEHFKVVCGTCKCAPGLTSDADGDVVVAPVADKEMVSTKLFGLQPSTMRLVPPSPSTGGRLSKSSGGKPWASDAASARIFLTSGIQPDSTAQFQKHR